MRTGYPIRRVHKISHAVHPGKIIYKDRARFINIIPPVADCLGRQREQKVESDGAVLAGLIGDLPGNRDAARLFPELCAAA